MPTQILRVRPFTGITRQAQPAVRHYQPVDDLCRYLVARDEDRPVICHRKQSSVEHPVQVPDKADHCGPRRCLVVLPDGYARPELRVVPAVPQSEARHRMRNDSHRLRAPCGETQRLDTGGLVSRSIDWTLEDRRIHRRLRSALCHTVGLPPPQDRGGSPSLTISANSLSGSRRTANCCAPPALWRSVGALPRPTRRADRLSVAAHPGQMGR